MSRSVPEWIGKSADSPVPARVQVRVRDRAGGKCQNCRKVLGSCEKGETDHDEALVNWTGEGHGNRESNLRLLCRNCHSAKTKVDVATKAKGKRVRNKLMGIKKVSSRPILGSKQSGWKKGINRPAERRT